LLVEHVTISGTVNLYDVVTANSWNPFYGNVYIYDAFDQLIETGSVADVATNTGLYEVTKVPEGEAAYIALVLQGPHQEVICATSTITSNTVVSPLSPIYASDQFIPIWGTPYYTSVDTAPPGEKWLFVPQEFGTYVLRAESDDTTNSQMRMELSHGLSGASISIIAEFDYDSEITAPLAAYVPYLIYVVDTNGGVASGTYTLEVTTAP
jgi:hypothetical protein